MSGERADQRGISLNSLDLNCDKKRRLFCVLCANFLAEDLNGEYALCFVGPRRPSLNSVALLWRPCQVQLAVIYVKTNVQNSQKIHEEFAGLDNFSQNFA